MSNLYHYADHVSGSDHKFLLNVLYFFSGTYNSPLYLVPHPSPQISPHTFPHHPPPILPSPHIPPTRTLTQPQCTPPNAHTPIPRQVPSPTSTPPPYPTLTPPPPTCATAPNVSPILPPPHLSPHKI